MDNAFILVIVIFLLSHFLEKACFAFQKLKLTKKYGDEELADKIMKGSLWKGQTEEQLIDSVGRPTYFVQEEITSRTRDIWMYEQDKAKYGRYRDFGTKKPKFEVYLENGIVMSWSTQENSKSRLNKSENVPL